MVNLCAYYLYTFVFISLQYIIMIYTFSNNKAWQVKLENEMKHFSDNLKLSLTRSYQLFIVNFFNICLNNRSKVSLT